MSVAAVVVAVILMTAMPMVMSMVVMDEDCRFVGRTRWHSTTGREVASGNGQSDDVFIVRVLHIVVVMVGTVMAV